MACDCILGGRRHSLPDTNVLQGLWILSVVIYTDSDKSGPGVYCDSSHEAPGCRTQREGHVDTVLDHEYRS